MLAIFCGGAYLLLTEGGTIRPIVGRMLAAAGILGFLGFIFWLMFPEGPLWLTVIFVMPTLFAFITAAVWPERKGHLWPYGNRPYTRRVFLQNWVTLWLGLNVFLASAAFLYSAIFPNPYWPVRQSWLFPQTNLQQTFAILMVITGVAFFLQLWRFIRMLPPKK